MESPASSLRVPALLLVLSVALASLACSGAPPDSPSILLVVIDTLRADHLGVYGHQIHPTSPNLDALAERAAVFDNAYATSPWTLPSMGSIYTGEIPTRHGAGVMIRDVGALPPRTELDSLIRKARGTFYALDPGLSTLAERMRERGYVTAAVVNNPFLDPQFGIDRGFDSYDYTPDDRRKLRTADAGVDAALAWFREHVEGSGDGRPFFFVLHLFDPHMPYAAPEPWLGRFSSPWEEIWETPVDNFFPIREEIRHRSDLAEDAAAFQIALYDEEIAFADHHLGRLFDWLKEAGRYDETVIAVTSDHGEEFYEHRRFEHGAQLYDEALRVPMIFRGPGIDPGRHATPVSLVDLYPTLLEVAGMEPESEVEGVSLASLLAGAGAGGTGAGSGAGRPGVPPRFDRLLFAERSLYGSEKKAVIRWPMKAIVDYEKGRERLYDLEADPGETVNLFEERKELYLELLARLQEILRTADHYARDNEIELDPETLEKIRALGYLR